jgi:hypothetical protein
MLNNPGAVQMGAAEGLRAGTWQTKPSHLEMDS